MAVCVFGQGGREGGGGVGRERGALLHSLLMLMGLT